MKHNVIRLCLVSLLALGCLIRVAEPVAAHAGPSNVDRCYQWCLDNWQEFSNACVEYYGYGDHGDPERLQQCRRLAETYYQRCNQEASQGRRGIPWRQEFPFPGGPHGL